MPTSSRAARAPSSRLAPRARRPRAERRELRLLHRRHPRRRALARHRADRRRLRRRHPHRHRGHRGRLRRLLLRRPGDRASSRPAARWCPSSSSPPPSRRARCAQPDRMGGRHAGQGLRRAAAQHRARSRRPDRHARPGLRQRPPAPRRPGDRDLRHHASTSSTARAGRGSGGGPGREGRPARLRRHLLPHRGRGAQHGRARPSSLSPWSSPAAATAWPGCSGSRRRPTSARPSSRATTRSGPGDDNDRLRPHPRPLPPARGLIYLDGNSLGPLPKAAVAAVTRTLRRNGAGADPRLEHPRLDRPAARASATASPALIGAPPGTRRGRRHHFDQDLPGPRRGLALRPDRRVILSDSGNFPTDLYMAAGLATAARRGYDARDRRAPRTSRPRIDEDVAVAHAHRGRLPHRPPARHGRADRAGPRRRRADRSGTSPTPPAPCPSTCRRRRRLRRRLHLQVPQRRPGRPGLHLRRARASPTASTPSPAGSATPRPSPSSPTTAPPTASSACASAPRRPRLRRARGRARRLGRRRPGRRARQARSR